MDTKLATFEDCLNQGSNDQLQRGLRLKNQAFKNAITKWWGGGRWAGEGTIPLWDMTILNVIDYEK